MNNFLVLYNGEGFCFVSHVNGDEKETLFDFDFI